MNRVSCKIIYLKNVKKIHWLNYLITLFPGALLSALKMLLYLQSENYPKQELVTLGKYNSFIWQRPTSQSRAFSDNIVPGLLYYKMVGIQYPISQNFWACFINQAAWSSGLSLSDSSLPVSILSNFPYLPWKLPAHSPEDSKASLLISKCLSFSLAV